MHVSLLELNTLAYALCAFLTYLLWWEKPLDIEEPLLVYMRKSSRSTDGVKLRFRRREDETVTETEMEKIVFGEGAMQLMLSNVLEDGVDGEAEGDYFYSEVAGDEPRSGTY